MQMSERKRVSPGCQRDLFHVINKVPAGDSPYSKAKQVQLLEKDPSRAISLFWAAINAGDRVDSALKDMAVVMKQLNRSDEAIEAIKSFRHLCTYDSQESLDNVLLELYKRTGRLEEEIEMLQRKLKNLDEGIAFSRKRPKIARAQGKKIQITFDQEKSRILGNLAWAYLQCHNYGLAEQHYRKALSLEPDKNKQCNLAICLLHMNRTEEAKSLLRAITASCGSKQMDISYAKSFDRAVQMLTESESHVSLKKTEQDENNATSSVTPTKAVPINGCQSYVSGFTDSRRWSDGHNEETVLSDEQNVVSSCLSLSENQGNFYKYNAGNSPLTAVENSWRKGPCLETPVETPAFVSYTREIWMPSDTQKASRRKNVFSSPAPVLYTQPRRGSQKFMQPRNSGEQPTGNMLALAIRNLSGELLDSTTDEKSGSVIQNCQSSLASPASNGNRYSTKIFSECWADIVEAEEEKEESFASFDGWQRDGNGGSNDENQNCNVIHQSCPKGGQVLETISQKLEGLNLRDGRNASLRNPSARRSLCFEAGKNANTKGRNRLQVFREITPSPDSP